MFIENIRNLINSKRGGKSIATSFIDRPTRFNSFISWFIPSFIIIILFVIIPIFFILRDSSNKALFSDDPQYSQAQYNYSFGLKSFSFVASDKTFQKGIINSLIYILFSIPVTIFLAICISGLIISFMNKKLKSVLQTFFFIPYVTSIVAITLVFANIFGDNVYAKGGGSPGNGGVINEIVAALGGKPEPFLRPSLNDEVYSPLRTTMVIAIFGSWRTLAFNIFILTTAMLSINKDLYRASAIDGAGRTKQFFSITLPQVRSSLMYLLTISVIQSLKVFPLPAYTGDTGAAIRYFPTLMMYVVHKTNIGQYGSAAAASIFVLLISMAASIIVRLPLYRHRIKKYFKSTRSILRELRQWR